MNFEFLLNGSVRLISLCLQLKGRTEKKPPIWYRICPYSACRRSHETLLRGVAAAQPPTPAVLACSPSFFSKMPDTPVDALYCKKWGFSHASVEKTDRTKNRTIAPTWPAEVPKRPRKGGCRRVGTPWGRLGARHWVFFSKCRTTPY